MIDDIAREILKTIHYLRECEPLGTPEVQERLAKKGIFATRNQILYRLQALKEMKKINGKLVGRGHGCFIWYKVVDRHTYKKDRKPRRSPRKSFRENCFKWLMLSLFMGCRQNDVYSHWQR